VSGGGYLFEEKGYLFIMHPRDLKSKYGLSYMDLGFYLACDRRTAERYCSPACPKPNERVFLVCYLLDFYWVATGKVCAPDVD
jgi:hypothetical protein